MNTTARMAHVNAGRYASCWEYARYTGGEGGIRTPDRAVKPYNGLANRRLQPLGHLSADTATLIVSAHHGFRAVRFGFGRRRSILIKNAGRPRGAFAGWLRHSARQFVK